MDIAILSDTWWQWLGLWLSAFVSATILPGSSEVVAAAVITQQPQRWLWVFVVATAGNTMGAMTSYGLGRLLPSKYPASAHMIAWIQRYGVWSLLLSWMPIIGDGLVVAAGWLRLNLYLSLLMLLVGKAIRYGVLIWFTLKVMT